MAKTPRYDAIIVRLFQKHYSARKKSFEFQRTEFERIARELSIQLPKNIGDILYSFRFRRDLPSEISKTAPEGYEWIIELAGHAKYRFVLSKINRIIPREGLLEIKVPDATPEIVGKHALSDEQALLAKVRYNRLVDIFLGIAAYSLQSHLRTTVKNIGQIEIDELYIGVNKHGSQFIVPVQAKGGNDQIGVVQIRQDVACCEAKFQNLICRPIATQFIKNDLIAMFELSCLEDEIRIVDEKHYRLVPAERVTPKDLDLYRRKSE